MAFMMPLVKQNYSLYNTPGTNNVTAGNGTVSVPIPTRRIRKNSDQTDRRMPGAGSRVVLRRNAKSEGASLSSSPGYVDPHGQHNGAVGNGAQANASKPVEIRRGRFSIPAFLSPQSSVRKSGSGKQRQASSVPNPTKSPPVKPTFSPSSRSSLSSTSSSDSIKDSNNGFHSRLLMRLRKTLGLGHKEARPTSS